MVPFRISVVSYRVVDFTERFYCKFYLPAARASNRTKVDAVGRPERGQLPDALTGWTCANFVTWTDSPALAMLPNG